ncbi:hypothetical protein [Haloplasma contractile]|uniref:Uncharacterized protein n=1 Tax=Haloplasma contractile SSD-17B TaxID=1033810 RepID=U2FQ02_9MOLU|nr:hypothetical protein [Haloplasma contractile]ERJ13124.1 hypothetical protein HLPCO_000743 [Haloplasma contractile SSD-17B]
MALVRGENNNGNINNPRQRQNNTGGADSMIQNNINVNPVFLNNQNDEERADNVNGNENGNDNGNGNGNGNNNGNGNRNGNGDGNGNGCCQLDDLLCVSIPEPVQIVLLGIPLTLELPCLRLFSDEEITTEQVNDIIQFISGLLSNISFPAETNS